MIINRSHLPWALFVVVATLAVAALYLEIFQPALMPRHIPAPASLGVRPFGHRSVGATPLGITYGTIAFVIFVFLALLGARKKVRAWRIGTAESWMRAHIWLSVLTVPLVAFHCGFRSGSTFTTSLLILYAVVMLSGFYGLALQQFIPRQMTDSLSREVIYEQIPYLRKQLIQSAMEMRDELKQEEVGAAGAHLAAAISGTGAVLPVQDQPAERSRAALNEMLTTSVLPYLRARKGSRSRLGRAQISEELFRILSASVSAEYHGKVDDLQRWCDQRRQMDLQTKMQHWLHYWLLVHVPVSLLLLIWTAWHAVSGLFFY